MDWGEIFFILHKHCNLDKWQIWEYTLPQVEDLCKRIHRYIQFEISTRMPFLPFGGTSGDSGSAGGSETTEDGYTIATADDIDLLAKALGG